MDNGDLFGIKWNSLNEEFNNLEKSYKEYLHLKNDVIQEKDNCQKKIKTIRNKINNISDYLKKCQLENKLKEIQNFNEILDDLKNKKENLNKIVNGLPKDNGKYLKIIIGSVNVCLPDQNSRFKYKSEYQRFKLVVTAVILIITIINLIIRYKFVDALLQFLHVWYHCTLTIRESILIVNGSRIKGWWRLLQFITTIGAGIMIVWPEGLLYDEYRLQYLIYTMYTSFIQILQYYYQQGVLYRLRALGERNEMDVTIQGFHSWMWKGLSFLLPFLYIAYIFQFYNSFTLYKLSLRKNCIEWQIPVLSFINLIIFLGNVITTSLVLQQKLKEKIREEIIKNLIKYK